MSFKTWFRDFLGNTKNEQGYIVGNSIEGKIQEIYYKELAIQTAISLIANAIAKCEIKVYENNKEVKNEIYYKLNIEPNKNESSSQLWHKAIEKMIYNKESIIIDVNNEFHCVDTYYPEQRPILGNLYKGIVIGPLQLNKIFRCDEVIRLQLNNAHIKKLIDEVYVQYGELLAYSAKNYKKSNGSKYKLSLEQVKVNDETFQRTYRDIIQSQLKSFMESDNAIYPQYKGYNLEDISSKNNKDSSDFRNLRKEMFEIVAQAFQIPVSLMLGNITNIQDIVNMFLTFSIEPYANMISEECTRKIYPGYTYWNKGNYIKVDTSTINHIDILEVAEKTDKLISSGICCIDEIRVILGLDPLNTEFSRQHFITKNYDTVENRLIGDVNNDEGGEMNE